jgi:hypothetical protein
MEMAICSGKNFLSELIEINPSNIKEGLIVSRDSSSPLKG